MRSGIVKLLTLVVSFFCLSASLSAQNCFNTGLNGTVINLPCNQNCVNIPVRIPHIKATSDYIVNSVAYNPFPYLAAGGAEDAVLYADDKYSSLIDLPFSFCFYDSVYTKMVVGSNGLITFDERCKEEDNAYTLTNAAGNPQPIFYNVGNAPGGIATTYYPPASIMGIYTDLDPRITEGPPDRKIQWRAEGSAPCRRFVISYYRVGVYNSSSTTCGETTPVTFQIVIYESTGIVEVFIANKSCLPSTTKEAILGLQNWYRNKAVAAPGKNATIWNASNEGYRFTPSGGASRFKSCKVYNLDGTFIANGDTITTTAGLLDVTFPTFCPTGATGKYLIKTVFYSCGIGATELESTDTITINKTSSLTATGTTTQTTCGASSGTATITVPAGIGTAPYTFVLNPGNITQTSNAATTFSGLAAGSYTVTVTDAGSCSSTVPVAITSTGVLGVNFEPVATTCFGASNGQIKVDQLQGTAPYTFTLNPGGITQTGPGPYTFTGLAANTYFVSVYDVGGCKAENIPVTVEPGASITMTMAATSTSCPGANNGKITITGCTGTPPFQYSINAGPYQASPIFSNLAAGTYYISLKDALGCRIDFIPETVEQGNGTLTGTATPTATSCSGASDGSITVTPTTGSGPYEYSINSGGNWQASNIFSGLAAGNYTIIIREGGMCTSGNIGVAIPAGATLTGTATSTATACTGVNNGTITITPTNGTGPFEYSLDGGAYQSSNTFSGVAAGSHTVKIRNAAGCISNNISAPVAVGSTLTATISSANTSCSGATDGTISITPTNGSGPYQYALDTGPFQASSTFNGVAAGPHTVKFKDNFGCISQDIPVTITAGPVLTGTATSTSTACIGVDNGSISVTPGAAFTGPFEYKLDAGAFQASATFTGVAAGPHDIIIRNAAGCISAGIPVSVATGSTLTANVSSTPTSCSGATDGTITVAPTNGSGPYQYALGTGPFQANAVFTGISAGPHTIRFKDNFGCISPGISVTVTAGPVLTGTATSTSTACTGVNNGSITVTPGTGFTGSFEYSLDGGVYQSSPTFTGIAAGSHVVKIRNAAGCISPDINIPIATGTTLTATGSAISTSCSGATDGSVTITPTNGSSPYQYALDGGAYQAGATFTGLTAGPHTVVVKDNFGCISAPVSITVPTGPVLVGTVTSTPTACAGVNNGTITATTPVNGFIGPFEFSLDGGAFQSSNTFTGVAAGPHSVVIRNVSGCYSAPIGVTVATGSSLTGTAASTAVSCNGGTNGAITATPDNGSAPFQYALNGGSYQSSNTFNGLAANTYTVTIKDAFGCIAAPISVTVTQPAVLSVPAPVVQPVTCNGASNGVITVSPAGGTAPYTYSLNNISFQAGNTFTVAQGTYTVYVKDAKGCTAQAANVIVTQPAALTGAISSIINASCNGGSDGIIQVAANGGTPPYEYSYDGTNFQSSNQLFVRSGSYTVTIKDANNCTRTIPNVVVGLTDNLTLIASNPPPICEGSSAQLTVVSNGTSYAWTSSSLNPNLTGAATYNPVAAPTTTTTYTVTATLGSCTKTTSVTVTVLAAPVPDAGAGGEICFGQDYQLQGSGGLTYNWSPATYLDNSTAAAPHVIKPSKTITYTLSVTDANNCRSLVTDEAVVTVIQPIKVKISPADTVVYAGAQFQLVATSAGVNYVWTPATGLDNPYIADPVVTAPSFVGAEVLYKVTASTAAGCEGEATATVRVYEGPEIYVVNAFTPNNDGRNDVFIPFPVGIRQLNYFRIFNRWGNLVYATNELHQGWDGKMKGIEQPGGVYVWMVQGITEDGKLITKKGTVTLIR